jgi:tRNA (guanosine-2'-O-)-methyltransferase
MPSPARLSKLHHVASQRQQGVVILENISDPHNAAAVLRSCESFGIAHIYYIFETTPRFNPARIGKASSSSANKWLEFSIFESTKECLAHVKTQGYTIFGTVLADDAVSLYDASFLEPKTALMFGNEHAGLTQEAIEGCDVKVMLPMRGFVQSLNLSVTAGIFLFELTRQRLQNPAADYSLPESLDFLLQKAE